MSTRRSKPEVESEEEVQFEPINDFDTEELRNEVIELHKKNQDKNLLATYELSIAECQTKEQVKHLMGFLSTFKK